MVGFGEGALLLLPLPVLVGELPLLPALVGTAVGAYVLVRIVMVPLVYVSEVTTVFILTSAISTSAAVYKSRPLQNAIQWGHTSIGRRWASR